MIKNKFIIQFNDLILINRSFKNIVMIIVNFFNNFDIKDIRMVSIV